MIINIEKLFIFFFKFKHIEFPIMTFSKLQKNVISWVKSTPIFLCISHISHISCPLQFNIVNLLSMILENGMFRPPKKKTPSSTCASGCSDPKEAAPSLTTSARRVIVLTAHWAALASCSWLEAAPATSVLVSSTRALAVFRMFSLRDYKTNTLFCRRLKNNNAILLNEYGDNEQQSISILIF